ncbi:MAG: tripartite tricarboxylate transporter substrate binding protein [Rhizobiales bacterium]|nr:tripartite tricarboxylate transporter substrate binding protein [Hyphomicrobiales bacterium]
MNRFTLALLVLTIAGAAPAAAQSANNYPDRPVRLVIPFPAGSSTDVMGRIVAQKLGAKFGQQVVVENRPGASGSIGADLVAKAAPDGYTIGLITASTHGVSPVFNSKLPYDPIKDFKPLSMIGAAPYVLVIYAGLPVKSVKDLIDLAKAKPGTINYGSAGLASLAHLGTAQFADRVGIQIMHVPYRASSQSVIDIISGRLEMQIATLAPTMENIRNGKLRALATTGRRRVATLPDVPTMIEAGVPDYELVLWMAFVMPPQTPDAIVGKLNAAMTDILSAPDTKQTLAQQGFEPEPGPPANVTQRITDDIAKWKSLIAATGLKISDR